MAEAEAAVAVVAELAQGGDAGFAAREATRVVSFHGSRDQGIDVFFCLSWFAWGAETTLNHLHRHWEQPQGTITAAWAGEEQHEPGLTVGRDWDFSPLGSQV